MSQPHYHIYAIGNALVDTEVQVQENFLQDMDITKGIMTLVNQEEQGALLEALRCQAPPQERASGGSAANTVIAASYFGAKCFFSCRVADDETGAFYVRDIQAAGVNTNMAGQRPEGVSGTCVVMVTPDAERTMYTYLGIAEEVSIEDIDEAAVKASDYVYIEGYLVTSATARPAAKHLAELARANNTKVSLTFSDPAMAEFFRDGLKEVIGPGVDLLFCNEEEAQLFTETHSLEEALEALKTYSQQVVITRGPKGAVAWDGETLHQFDGVPVEAVDTTGAGDLFAGAFLYALSQGKGFAEAGPFACHSAAQVVKDFGPRLTEAQYVALKQAFFKE